MSQLRVTVLAGLAIGTAAVITPPPAGPVGGPAADPHHTPRADRPPERQPAEPARAGPADPSPTQPPLPEPLARFGDTRLRHAKEIQAIALRPDGKAVAASAYDSPVVIEWDAASGRELRRYAVELGNRPPVIEYAPDGRRLHFANGRAVLTLDTATGTLVSRTPLKVAAVAPDGKTLGGLDEAGNLLICDVATGKTVRSLGRVPMPESGWIGVCFSPGGKEVAACVAGGSVYVAATEGTQPLREIAVPGQDNGVQKVAWPRPDRLVAVWYNGFAIHDPGSGRQLARKTGDYGCWLTTLLPANGRLFAYITNAPKIVEIDLDTGSHVPGRAIPVRWLSDPLAISADGTRIAVAEGYAVRVLNAADGQPLHPDLDLCPTRPADTIQFSADGRRMLTRGYECVRVWDFPAGKPLAVMDREARTLSSYSAQLSPDGRWVAGADDRRVVVLDAETGAVVFRQPPPAPGRSGRPHVIGFDPAGRLWVMEWFAAGITCHDIPSGRVVQTIKGFDQTVSAKLSPNGRKLVVGGWKAFAVRDTDPAAGWHVVETYPGRRPGCGLDTPPCPVPVGFTPDGTRLITTRPEALVWDVTGKPAVVGKRDDPGRLCAVSPDRRRMAFLTRAAEGKPPELRVWETATLAEVFRVPLPPGVGAFAVTPDGRRLVLAHGDTTLTLHPWEWTAFQPADAGKTPVTAAALWERLGSRDPKAGLAAVRALAADPAATLALFRERFRPCDPAKVRSLVADLGDEDFATREKAENELAGMGPAVEGLVSEAVRSPNPEVSTRAQRVLAALKPSIGVRAIRAVEVLERIGSKEAKELLSEWARTDGSLGAEAGPALARLSKTGP